MPTESEAVLVVDKATKIYSRERRATKRRLARTLSRVLLGRSYDTASSALQTGEFYAVKNVSFSLRRGEALGIIGLNGSGKTTLLRMLAGQILPDAGEIRVIGGSASMIDLTAGFQPGASGRENIFLRGAALGRSHKQMEADLESIIDFSELGDAIEAPVATYSSGMTMRLAFSIISASAPDLLFIDEVLAVGDFRFRQKCLGRVRELRDTSAFVMVSHSMLDITRFCEKTIVLDKGNMAFFGDSDDAVRFFESEIEEQKPVAKTGALSKVVGKFYENKDAIQDLSFFWGDRDRNPVTRVIQGGELFFYAKFKCNIKVTNLIIGIPVWASDGTSVTSFSSDQRKGSLKVDADGYVSVRLNVPSLHFNAGVYHSNFVVVNETEFLWRTPNTPFEVVGSIHPQIGVVTLPSEWEPA
jgi:ABC-type polysaccharide/polyol phosphate transport system ATPase subunit